MSSVDSSNQKPVSTVPDDVFYVLKLILTRMLSAGNPNFVQTGLSSFRSILEQYYIEKYKNKLDGAYIQDTHGVRGEKLERESRQIFIVRIESFDYRYIKTME